MRGILRGILRGISRELGTAEVSGRRVGAQPGWVAFAFLVALAAGCGGGGGEIECPPSYVPVDGACQPLFRDVADGGSNGGLDAVVPSDSGGDAGLRPDTAPDADAAADGAGGDVGTPDVPAAPDVPAPTGAVGDPCRRDRDCQDGLLCLGWAGGYCTRLGCDQPEVGCPAGSLCLRVEAGAAACFRSCQGAADCRADGYACKALADDAGEPAAVCHEVWDDAGVVGAPCTGHAECVGHLACVRSLPGGACLSLFCGDDGDCASDVGLPLGGACVRFDGVNTCLARCGADGDCGTIGDGTLSCETRRNTSGQSLSVCISGASGLAIGAACLADGECDSGVCETLGDGRCTLDDLPCFDSGDCPAAATCIPVDPPVNACSATCGGAGQVCPSGACVLGDGGASACRPACRWDAGHTSHDCRPETGWTCAWGVPLKDESRKGYYCAPAASGRIGAACRGDNECADSLATCLRAADRPDADVGYCSRACSPQQPCPFGTYCLPHGAAWRCQKVCFSPLDCADGHVCRSGAPYGSCAPE